MKEIYKAVNTILIGDATLVSLVDYAPASHKNTIRRGYQTFELKKGYWDKMVVFYLQPAILTTDFTAQIRTIPLIVRVYDRKDDLNVETIGERCIALLDSADLSVATKIHAYSTFYDGDLIATSWSDELKSYEKALRFVVNVHNKEAKS